MTKRTRSDTAAGAVEAMRGATALMEPPEHCHVPQSAMPYWRSITKARAADRWNDSDLETAAELARTKASIERLQRELENESDCIENQRGTLVVNPKHSLLETLTRRMVALSRMLQVHAEATQGKARDQVKKNQAQQAAQVAMSDDDCLIPKSVQ